jgi:hypothetical protein
MRDDVPDPVCTFPAADRVVCADAGRMSEEKTRWPHPLAQEAKMSVQPLTPHQPHQAPRGPTGQLAGRLPGALFLLTFFSGAAIIATILVLLVIV